MLTLLPILPHHIQTLPPPPRRSLTSENGKSTKPYVDDVTQQIQIHKLVERVDVRLQKAMKDPVSFTDPDASELNNIDEQLTDIMLTGEKLCACRKGQRQDWSPQQHLIARTYSYWQQRQ